MPKHEYRGILVAVEGIDGAGKTTQVKMLAEALQAAGVEVVTSKEPTDGVWGRKIRQSATTGRMPVEEELEAFVHDRTEHVETLIGPALEAGKTVILDRYYLSSVAYQGSRGQSPAAIRELMESRFPIPDLAVLIEIDTDQSHVRISEYRNETPNEFEQREALARALAIFRETKWENEVRIDGGQAAAAVHRQIVEAYVAGPAKARLCAKAEGCGDTANCSYRQAGTCAWAGLRERLLG